MFGFIKKILGSKSDKDLKDLYPLVDDINIEFDKLKNISDDELRNKTFEFKEIIQNNLNDSNQVIDSLREKYKKSDGSLSEKENILNEIDSLKESQKEIIEKTLNELLPEAFAVVKETARRFTENESLEVTASDFDRELASKKDNIEIDGSKAVWYNEWSAAGVDIKWNMIHYDVQLIGGIVLHQGKISEMAT
ncbi:MAG: preprotein translocase subunit SecA, partial [Bacteroidota bacterium]|nr:preprotein translocase subunit SecA [Bacteroidota bacterium]